VSFIKLELLVSCVYALRMT